MPPEILPQLFNSYVEIHTAQLGVLVGLFVGLCYWYDRRLAYALLFLSVLMALGNGSRIGWEAIDRKPWYFLSALYVTSAGNMLLVRYAPVLRRGLSRLRPGRSEPSQDGTTGRSGAEQPRGD